MRRGEIWWVDFGDGTSSAPALHRPGVIVSADALNRTRIATVLVVPLYSNPSYAKHPGNVMLPAQQTGLELDSVANVSQLGSVDRTAVLHQIGVLPPSLITLIDAGLSLVLDLH